MSSAVSKLFVLGWAKVKPFFKEVYAILVSEYSSAFLTGFTVCLFIYLPSILSFLLAVAGLVLITYEYHNRK